MKKKKNLQEEEELLLYINQKIQKQKSSQKYNNIS